MSRASKILKLADEINGIAQTSGKEYIVKNVGSDNETPRTENLSYNDTELTELLNYYDRNIVVALEKPNNNDLDFTRDIPEDIFSDERMDLNENPENFSATGDVSHIEYQWNEDAISDDSDFFEPLVPYSDRSDSDSYDVPEKSKKRKKRFQVNKRPGILKKNESRRKMGKSYFGRQKINGKWNYDMEKTPRELKERCCCKTKANGLLKCNKISEEERNVIFKYFWNLSWGEKKVFVDNTVKSTAINRPRDRKDPEKSKRKQSLMYYLRSNDTDIRVCRKMYVNTTVADKTIAQPGYSEAELVTHGSYETIEKATYAELINVISSSSSIDSANENIMEMGQSEQRIKEKSSVQSSQQAMYTVTTVNDKNIAQKEYAELGLHIQKPDELNELTEYADIIHVFRSSHSEGVFENFTENLYSASETDIQKHDESNAQYTEPNNIANDGITNSDLPTENFSRKRQRNPEKWKRNAKKKLRMAGSKYETRAKVRIKTVQVVDCKCHYKCTTNINRKIREQLLADYLTLETERGRWSFIGKQVTSVPVKRRYMGDNNRRKRTLEYSISINGTNHRVCKKFFLGTYDISEKKVRTSVEKLAPTGVTKIDHRSKKEPPNKKSDEVKNLIRDHIKSLPVVASHYIGSKAEMKEIKQEQKKCLTEIQDLKKENTQIRKENQEIKKDLIQALDRIDRLENKKRRNNVVIQGLPIETNNVELRLK
ncbi:unnamed protein product [Diabrotica balteata]|uniref:Uncharacterized protein n=1 Tax=Diabrotica balteata TaxID=107213 RepID=A0A9P0DR70_DIABA|nr:unnamed protein product [Diabrotica balteata]